MSSTMVCRWQKNKRKHWLKRLRAVPKMKFGTKYKWFKISYLDFLFFIFFFFFENIISGIQRSHIRPHVSVNIIRDFFLFSDFLEESILSDFANFPANMFQFSVRKNICAALFLDTQELHSWSTLKANICVFLYISV